MPFVVVRADASRTIGSGHIMRMLALIGEFRNAGWQIGFAASEETLVAVPLLAAKVENILKLYAAADEAEAMKAHWPEGADVLIVDHYGRNAELERACRPWAKKIVVIDDLADRAHDADILIDSGAISDAPYVNLLPKDCKILTGSTYAIVHPDFVRAREAALPRRDGRPVSRILVTLGQMDPDNVTTLALDAIEATDFGGSVDVALGHAAPHLSSIRRRAKGRVNLHVSASNMPALMATSDLAIGAGGVASWERACLGLPSVLIEIADNQRAIIANLSGQKAAVYAGSFKSLSNETLANCVNFLVHDRDARIEQAKAAATLVDGKGIERIVAAIVL